MNESLLRKHEQESVGIASPDAVDHDPPPGVDDLLEDVSIDGMCGVY